MPTLKSEQHEQTIFAWICHPAIDAAELLMQSNLTLNSWPVRKKKTNDETDMMGDMEMRENVFCSGSNRLSVMLMDIYFIC